MNAEVIDGNDTDHIQKQTGGGCFEVVFYSKQPPRPKKRHFSSPPYSRTPPAFRGPFSGKFFHSCPIRENSWRNSSLGKKSSAPSTQRSEDVGWKARGREGTPIQGPTNPRISSVPIRGKILPFVFYSWIFVDNSSLPRVPPWAGAAGWWRWLPRGSRSPRAGRCCSGCRRSGRSCRGRRG